MERSLRTTKSFIRHSKWAEWGQRSAFTVAESRRIGSRLSLLGPLLAVIAAIGLWVGSLQGVDLSRMTDVGLISVLPLRFYLALVILTLSFALVVHRRQAPIPLLLLHLVALILMIHATPIVLEGTLRYSWAWKHVGIVDYIQRHGSVNPDIASLNVYHNWPGFFALSALLTEVAGFPSALNFANGGPVFFNLLDLGALLLILQTGSLDRRLVWLSLWFFYLANWVGQDYFAPQAMNYFLYLVIMGICLKWFSVTAAPAPASMKRWLRFDWPVRLYYGLVTYGVSDNLGAAPAQPLQRVGLMTMVILLFMAVASSHPLTPFMAIGAILALVIFQRCNARTLPILLGVLAGTWVSYMAAVFIQHGNIVEVIQSIGHLFDNIGANLIDLSPASPGQKLIALMSRSLTAAVGLLALCGGVRRLRHGYWDLSFILLVMAPFPLIAGNSYGGEMLFRIYFFALPFMAFFAAALLYPGPTSGTSWWTVILAVLLSITLLIGFCFAYYGKERMFYFSQKEVDAAQYLYDTAPNDSLIVDGTVNYPWGFKNYEAYTYLSLTEMSPTELASLMSDPANILAGWMNDRSYAAAYLIITRSQKANVEMLGLLPPGLLVRIEQTLAHSPKFKLIYANGDAKIFKLAGGG
jgi:hypothetical protein